MAAARTDRKLVAVLAADVVGFARLMGADETGTLARLESLRRDVVDPTIAAHRGRTIKLMGDGVLVEFKSVVDAVACAVAIQQAVSSRGANDPPNHRIELRIGINLGDVIIQGRDIYGDGVNLAARLEGIAPAGGICVSGTVFEHVEGKLDLRFEDLGTQTLKNIARPLRVYRVVWQQSAAATGPTGATLPEPALTAATTMARPAVAVLPFTNMSRDPEQEYFSDGLTEDIITALSHWRWFPVIARNCTFTYKGQAVKVQQVAEELGARYVVEGSVRKAGQRIRVTVQLIDAESGHHVWAEKFDRLLEDIFDLQDEITQKVAAIVAPELAQAELRRAATKRPDSLTAWDNHLRGMAHIHLQTCEGYAAGREMFRRAVGLDPDYAEAWAGLGWSHLRDIIHACVDSPTEALEKGFEAARRALALDDESSLAHYVLGTAHVCAGELDLGIAGVERALELNPCFAQASMALGNRLDLIGRTEEGIAQMERSLDINPRDPHRALYMAFLARAHLSLEEPQKALGWARKAVRLRHDHPDLQYRLAICLAHLDRADEARAALGEAERLRPGFAARRAGWRPYADDARNERFFAGLRRHGLMG